MSNVTATVNSLANLLGNTSPEVKLELEKLFSTAVAEVLAGVNADADTLAEIRALIMLRAPIASPTFTGTVGGVTAAMVGAIPTFVGVPATAGAAGVAGTMAYASGTLYVCVATNTWEKVTIATWA